MLAQLNQQVQQLNTALEASMKEVQSLRKKTQDLEMQNALAEFEYKLDAVLAVTKAKAEASMRNVNEALNFVVKEQKMRDTSQRASAK